MSDAGSGSRFPFLKRNRNDDTPSDFSQRMDLNSPVTGEINQIFTPSQPRHAAAPSDATSDFPAMPTSTEGMDENTEREYAMALAQGMSLPFVDLNEYQVDKEVISMVPDDLCRRNQLLPLSIVNGRITVAMANPKNFAAIDDVSASTGMPVIPMVAMSSQVKDAINRYLRANAELTELSTKSPQPRKRKSTSNPTAARTPPPWHASSVYLSTRPSTTTAPISTSNRRKTVCSCATVSTVCCTCSKRRRKP